MTMTMTLKCRKMARMTMILTTTMMILRRLLRATLKAMMRAMTEVIFYIMCLYVAYDVYNISPQMEAMQSRGKPKGKNAKP